ncbi:MULTISPECIES: hypothetical protein [unclassified Nocardia]|uniref:hypothetical protein n=1 Tax=unclassified Nocardia TaxID=2637762 RepID=UPI00278BC11A|nr:MULTISPECIES: hypothetical protein [unclassified Nocardia]
MIATILAPLIWLAAATRLYRWWWTRSGVLAAAALALSVVALHLTLNIPAVERLVQEIAPVTNFSTAIRMVLFNFMAAAVGGLVLALTMRSAQHRVLWWARAFVATAVVGAVVALAIFLNATQQPQVAGGFEFDQAYAHLPGYAEAGIAGAIFPALLCPVLSAMTARAADSTTLTGWSLALLATGLTAASVWAWIRLCYLLGARYAQWPPSPLVFDITRAVAGIGTFIVFLGMMLPMVAGWVHAQHIRYRIAPLHRMLLDRHPGARRPSRTGATAPERAGDRVSEMLDALSVELAVAELPAAGSTAPADVIAGEVAEFLVGGTASAVLSHESLRAATDQVTADQWAVLVSRAYQERMNE